MSQSRASVGFGFVDWSELLDLAAAVIKSVDQSSKNPRVICWVSSRRNEIPGGPAEQGHIRFGQPSKPSPQVDASELLDRKDRNTMLSPISFM